MTSRRRGFQPLRDLPVMAWLSALVLVALVHPWMPAPRWLMLHLLLLGAVSHAIHVWSSYFTETLLHSAPSEQAARNRIRRLGLHNLGALAVITGALLDEVVVVGVGAASVAVAAGWHMAALLRQLRSTLGSRFAGVVRYYVAASSLLPVGALLGVLLATGLSGAWHDRVLYAHVTLNVLGWVGLTVLGTLLTLWPTMLRTRIAGSAERLAGRALPILVVAVLAASGGALAGSTYAVAAGVATYLVGIGVLAVPFVDAARRKPPTTFAPWSVLAGMVWLVGLLAPWWWRSWRPAAGRARSRRSGSAYRSPQPASRRRCFWGRCPTSCPSPWEGARRRFGQRPPCWTEEAPSGWSRRTPGWC